MGASVLPSVPTITKQHPSILCASGVTCTASYCAILWEDVQIQNDNYCPLFIDLSISAGSQPWVPTSTSRSYGGKSSRTWCGSSSACAAGSTASSLPCTALPGPPGQTRLAGWDIRPSKVMRWSYRVPVSLLPSLADSRMPKSEAGTPPEVFWMKYCYKCIKSIAVPTSQTLFHVILSSCPLWSIRQMKIKWILTSVLALALCYCCNIDQCF